VDERRGPVGGPALDQPARVESARLSPRVEPAVGGGAHRPAPADDLDQRRRVRRRRQLAAPDEADEGAGTVRAERVVHGTQVGGRGGDGPACDVGRRGEAEREYGAHHLDGVAHRSAGHDSWSIAPCSDVL
jgi:hypothetical protein